MALKFCLLVSDDLNYDVGRIEPDPEAVFGRQSPR